MAGVFVLALLLVAGCGRQAPTRPPATLVDDGGRIVALPRAPRRIISLIPSATETIVALGAGDRLVRGRPCPGDGTRPERRDAEPDLPGRGDNIHLEMSTGTGIRTSSVRVVPPSTSSLRRAWL